ncbi:hypothetical protein DIPPA_21075 [Diplonema papillatum]|nr:hypothetical protein DIPPA_21075 [Diplonema papillatum]
MDVDGVVPVLTLALFHGAALFNLMRELQLRRDPRSPRNGYLNSCSESARADDGGEEEDALAGVRGRFRRQSAAMGVKRRASLPHKLAWTPKRLRSCTGAVHTAATQTEGGRITPRLLRSHASDRPDSDSSADTGSVRDAITRLAAQQLQRPQAFAFTFEDDLLSRRNSFRFDAAATRPDAFLRICRGQPRPEGGLSSRVPIEGESHAEPGCGEPQTTEDRWSSRPTLVADGSQSEADCFQICRNEPQTTEDRWSSRPTLIAGGSQSEADCFQICRNEPQTTEDRWSSRPTLIAGGSQAEPDCLHIYREPQTEDGRSSRTSFLRFDLMSEPSAPGDRPGTTRLHFGQDSHTTSPSTPAAFSVGGDGSAGSLPSLSTPTTPLDRSSACGADDGPAPAFPSATAGRRRVKRPVPVRGAMELSGPFPQPRTPARLARPRARVAGVRAAPPQPAWRGWAASAASAADGHPAASGSWAGMCTSPGDGSDSHPVVSGNWAGMGTSPAAVAAGNSSDRYPAASGDWAGMCTSPGDSSDSGNRAGMPAAAAAGNSSDRYPAASGNWAGMCTSPGDSSDSGNRAGMPAAAAAGNSSDRYPAASGNWAGMCTSPGDSSDSGNRAGMPAAAAAGNSGNRHPAASGSCVQVAGGDRTPMVVLTQTPQQPGRDPAHRPAAAAAATPPRTPLPLSLGRLADSCFCKPDCGSRSETATDDSFVLIHADDLRSGCACGSPLV